MVLVEDGGLKAQCSGVDSLTGDCIINTRKGKHIPSYELALTLKWKGEKEGAHLEGKISFPYIAEENHDEVSSSFSDCRVVASKC